MTGSKARPMVLPVNNSRLEVVRGSVTELDVDAIVNAANEGMRGGGGIDGRIHSEAGPGLLEELRRVAPHGAKTGEVVVTGGHDMKQRYIFHTPGPVWEGGRAGEPELLRSCYAGCLRAVTERGLTSLGFCSISTGVFGYPIEQAAPLALETAVEHLQGETSLKRVVFALYGEPEYRAFVGALSTLG